MMAGLHLWAERHAGNANLERIRHGMDGRATLQGGAERDRTRCCISLNMLVVAGCGCATTIHQCCRRALSANCSWLTDGRL